MADNDLLSRLGNAEDNFVERKPANPNRDDVRKTVVAFANTIPEGRTAVLFVGIRNDGKFDAVPNPDKLQKKVREICEQDCYPPIKFSAEVLNPEGGPILAVVVPASGNKPHFSGPAYVRRGSESVNASAEVFDELIHSRNSKCAAVLKLKGQVISVLSIQHKLGIAKHIPDTNYREGAWVEDRWAVLKFTDKRKDENKYRVITDSAVFGLQPHYPFIVIASYAVHEIHKLGPDSATATVTYRRLAHTESTTGNEWRIVPESAHDETITLNLVFEKNKWLILDPPAPRIWEGHFREQADDLFSC